MTTLHSTIKHPAWSRQANIYEVNLRQYTHEGTFAAFQAHLPRLAAMGVDILWLMPVQPIGRKHRKGTLGSNYAVSDYAAVNPEFGTRADFKRLVDAAHAAGLRVILDWVANHTAWDHAWVAEHPGWYLKNAQGEIHSYEYDNGHEIEHWTDVVGLDYTQPDVRDAMIDALCRWVTEFGIDGFRCDVAMLLPVAFWDRARTALDAIKPVFMLAEAADPALHAHAFDMTYDWRLLDVMKQVAKGKAGACDLMTWLDTQAAYPADAYRMTFTTNHDKNAWEAHDGEAFGDAIKAFAVLAATLPGMPLVYGGQEAVLDRRLALFEKDPIEWRGFPLAGFYTALLGFKHAHPALANGAAGGPVERLATGSEAVFAFRRARGSDAVTVVVNLSPMPQPVELAGSLAERSIEPWGYRLLGG